MEDFRVRGRRERERRKERRKDGRSADRGREEERKGGGGRGRISNGDPWSRGRCVHSLVLCAQTGCLNASQDAEVWSW